MGCGIIHWNPGFCKEGQGGFVGFRALRASGRGNCVRFCGRPRGPPLRFYKNIFRSLDGRVLDPPLRRTKRPSFLFVGAGPRPARGGAHPRVASLGLRPIHLQPLPYRFQKTLPDLGRGGPWVSRWDSYQPSPARQNQAQPWNRTSRNFGTARAQWPGRTRKSPLRFCAPEILLHLSGTRPLAVLW